MNTYPQSINRQFIALLAVLSFPVMILLSMKMYLFISIYLLLLGVSFSVFFPRICFFLFLSSISIYMPTFIGRFALHPYDLVFALLVIAIVMDNLLKVRNKVTFSKIDIPFIFLICATIVSTIFAHNISYSIVPCFRIIGIYIAFRIFLNIFKTTKIKTVLNFYFYQVFILSVINIIIIALSGGQTRVFGLAWLTFETYAMTSIPMIFAFFLWSEKPAEKLKYAIMAVTILIALLGTQSRAPLLAIIAALPILILFSISYMDADKKQTVKKNITRIFMTLCALAVIGFLLKDNIFKESFLRISTLIDSLDAPSETVYLRIVLWTAAVKAFLSSPLTGIGIGNFKIVQQVIPEMRMVPVWHYISGMSVHNVILQYLAETGIFGTGSLIFIIITNLRTALKSMKIKQSSESRQISYAIFIGIFVYSITIFYMRAWTWGQDGYIMALLFAMNMGWFYKLTTDENRLNFNKS